MADPTGETNTSALRLTFDRRLISPLTKSGLIDSL
jgi:hypothetical protein